LAKRLHLPRSLSNDGKALVSIDMAEIRHTPRPQAGRHADDIVLAESKIEALQAEIARLQARAADHRADFGHDRERVDRLTVELLQATAATMAAKEAAARLEGEVAALRSIGRTGSPVDSSGQRRLGHLAATLVDADRKARDG